MGFGFLEAGLSSHPTIVDGGGIDGNGLGATMFLWIVQKMRRALTFLATIENDDPDHENAGGYSDFGAAHGFRGGLHRPASDGRSADRARGEFNPSLNCLGGTTNMLSVDQFLRLISLPAVVAAFFIASHVSGGAYVGPPQVRMASE
jgi:hypothetical protein